MLECVKSSNGIAEIMAVSKSFFFSKHFQCSDVYYLNKGYDLKSWVFSSVEAFFFSVSYPIFYRVLTKLYIVKTLHRL